MRKINLLSFANALLGYKSNQTPIDWIFFLKRESTRESTRVTPENTEDTSPKIIDF